MSYETQIIEMFLKDGANPNIIIDGKSPLHKAVLSENIKLVEILLKKGADPNIIKNIEGETYNYTPLNYACETLNIPIIKLLLEHGAIPNDNDDETNLGWIIEDDEGTSEQKIDAIKLLLEHGYKFYRHDYTELVGIKDYDIEIAKFLLQYIEDPDIKNNALLNAAKKDQIVMVTLLLENGADPNTVDKYNNDTPLLWAIENKNLPMMILLLDRGADPHYVWEDLSIYDPRKSYNMLDLARGVRFYSGLEYLKTYISEKKKLQNAEQLLATSMSLHPRLGQESLLHVNEMGLFDRVVSHLSEYDKYTPDVGRRMMLEDKQKGKGKYGGKSNKKLSRKNRKLSRKNRKLSRKNRKLSRKNSFNRF